jgi:O-antigen ligase
MSALLTERRGPVVWGIAALVSLMLIYGVAEEPPLVVAAFGAAAVVAAASIVLREPRWAIVGLVVAAYAGLFEAAETATALPVSKRLAVLGVVALILWHRACGSQVRLPARRDVVLVLGTLAAIAVSALVSVDSGATVHGLLAVATAAALALVIATLSEPQWLARAMWATALAGAALAALSLFQQLTGTYGNTYFGLAVVKLDAGIARSGGPFEPNFFAQALAFSTALAVYLTIRTRQRAERLAGVLFAALCVAGIGATASRGGALALGVMLALLLVLRRPRVRLVVPAAAAAILVGALVLPAETTTRLSSVWDTTDVERSLVQDTSFRGRFAESVTAVYMFRDSPLLGVGAGNYPVRYGEYATFAGREWRPVRQPHNLYLEAFAETGIVGGTVFLVFWWVTTSGAWRGRRGVEPQAALLAEGVFVGLIGLLTTSIFLHAAFLSIAWTAIGLAWAAAAMARTATARTRAAT